MAELPHFHVLGVKINAVRVSTTADEMERWIGEGRREYVVLTGSHGVVEMQSDPELLAINNASALTTPDGMPIVWLGRLAGYSDIEKVYAPDVMDEMFSRAPATGHRHFLYGGKPGVAIELKEVLQRRFPGIRIVGEYCPPFREITPDEEAAIAAQINAAEPDVVWCGLGCPKQERWMARFRPRLEAAVLIGVGAGFDFLTGTVPRAPRWIQVSGLEWLYRLLSDPKRLWPRYSRVVPLLLYYLARDSGRQLSRRILASPKS